MNIPRHYENLSVLHENTEPYRCYYIPDAVRNDQIDKLRESSERLQMLSGCEWNFAYFPSIYDLNTDFYLPSCRAAEWWNMEYVPFSWQVRGYDVNQYTNIRYPFPFDPPYVPQDNPCGAYRHHFTWHRDPKAGCTFLNFEGVDSCFYVWLNGTYVGYSQISHHTSEFDVTSYLKEGDNLLAVLVLKWCDGSYLEDQDKFRMSGIFRDVYLLNRPCSGIRDYQICTEIAPDHGSAELKVHFDFAGGHPVPVSLTLLHMDEDGTEHVDGRTQTYREHDACIKVEAPVLWNAEEPYLYTLILETANEVINEKVGFRTVCLKDNLILVNGRPITFNGVNRHESDPVYGAVTDYRRTLQDLSIIKEHNFNAVRASHYPDVPYFYQLCDMIGLYVIDEADNESHGTAPLYFNEDDYSQRMRLAHERIADNPDFVEPTLDRVKSMVLRNRNRPSILVWSMGNECGYGRTFEKALEWTRQTDPGRLTHYESAYYLPTDREYDCSNIDIFGRMYPSFEEIRDYLDHNPQKPLLLVEYCHAMGNGPGDFEDYHKLIEEYPALCGGFVWEFCDHSIYKGNIYHGPGCHEKPGYEKPGYEQAGHEKAGYEKPGYEKPGHEEGGCEKEKHQAAGEIHLYGGDHGELQHDSNFCLDGLVYPDRRPHTGLLEYKNVYRPLRASYDAAFGWLTISNHMDFTDPADKISASYALILDGTRIAEGPLLLPSIPPRTSVTLDLPLKIPVRGRCFLHISYVLKYAQGILPAGHELGFDEIPIPVLDPRYVKKIMLLDQAAKEMTAAEETGEGAISCSAIAETAGSAGCTAAARKTDSADCTAAAGKTDSATRLAAAETAESAGCRAMAQDPAFCHGLSLGQDLLIIVSGKNFHYSFDKRTGMPVSMIFMGEELLDRPVEFNFWRAPVDNDKPLVDLWRWERLDHTMTRAYEVTCQAGPACVEIRARQSACAMSVQPLVRMETAWKIGPGGALTLQVHADKDVHVLSLPRIGIRLFLKKWFNHAAYYGMGPMESYIDKHQAAWHGSFTASVNELHEPYIRPQENGSHYDCDYLALKGKGICLHTITADEQTFSFNVSRFTQEELEYKAHDFELEPCGSTVLCIDHRMSGLGSASCGPALQKAYRIDQDHYSFSFMLVPEHLN